MPEVSLAEILANSVALVAVTAPVLLALASIQSQSDFRLFDSAFADLLDQSTGSILRLLVPFTTVLATLGAVKPETGAASLSELLMALLVPVFMLASLAMWQKRQLKREKNVVLVASLVAFFLFYALETVYWQWVMGRSLGSIHAVQLYTVLASGLGFAALAAWRYLRSPEAYIVRLEAAAKPDDKVTRTLVRHYRERGQQMKLLASLISTFLWTCPGRAEVTSTDRKRASRVRGELGVGQAGPSLLRIGLVWWMSALVRVPFLAVSAFIDARFLNRALQQVSGETVWRWGPDLRDMELLYAQLDAQVFRARPLMLFHSVETAVLGWLIRDYLHHPDQGHHERVLAYLDASRPLSEGLRITWADRVSLFKRLAALNDPVWKSRNEFGLTTALMAQERITYALRRRSRVRSVIVHDSASP